MNEITVLFQDLDEALTDGPITPGQIIDTAPQSTREELFKMPELNSDDSPRYDGEYDDE